MSAPESAAQAGASWDEAQCMTALAQLEQLQAQVRSRRALTRIILKYADRRLAPRDTSNNRTLAPITESIYLQAILARRHWLPERHQSSQRYMANIGSTRDARAL